ncbi:MAG: radical SAM protein [Candidatus Diapherotrites archaeon]|nr:radical SAM protein [Candidatus Diapherotrites archaeon]
MAFKVLTNSEEGLSKACRQCVKGQEMVLFITGVCPEKCYYCPVSEERLRHDVMYANERKLKSPEDFEGAIREAKEMRALGCGIMGGEPLVVVDRVCTFIRALKQAFGKDFYIHLYTFGRYATKENLMKLEEAGLDEIRFHLFEDFGLKRERILPALETKMRVGVEIPCSTDKEKEIFELMDFIKAHSGISFVNLNELEFSESNFDGMKVHGHVQAHENTYAVKGSKELGQRIMQYVGNAFTVHFCTTHAKNTVQLGNRLKRRANTIKRPFEHVNAEGLMEKIVIEGPFENVLKDILNAHKERVYFNEPVQRLETNLHTAKKIMKKYAELGLKAARVLEFPTSDPWDFEKVPLEILRA